MFFLDKLAMSSASSLLHCLREDTDTVKKYSSLVVARVIWVTAPSALSSLLRGDGEKGGVQEMERVNVEK